MTRNEETRCRMTMPEPKLKIGDTVVLKRRWLLSIREERLTAQVEAY